MTSPAPIALNDTQLREIRAAAESLPPGLRGAYLERVADELRGRDLSNADGFGTYASTP